MQSRTKLCLLLASNPALPGGISTTKRFDLCIGTTSSLCVSEVNGHVVFWSSGPAQRLEKKHLG